MTVATDDPLLDAAREVLDRDGFHGATFAAVAAASGVPLADIHVRFADAGAMFLATVDRFLATQMGKYDDDVEATDFASAARAYGRKVANARLADGMPSWDRVLIEFWIVASRDPRIREEVRRRNTANLDRVGAILGGLVARYGREPVLSEREFARGVFAFGRGMGLERTMDDAWPVDELADMVAAYLIGLTRSRHASVTPTSLS
jgi:AcrR family transcriptional regulator